MQYMIISWMTTFMILQNCQIFAASTINFSKYLAIFRKLTLFRPGSGFLSLVSRGLWLLFTWNHSKAYKIAKQASGASSIFTYCLLMYIYAIIIIIIIIVFISTQDKKIHILCYNIWVKVYIFKLFTIKKKYTHIAKS